MSPIARLAKVEYRASSHHLAAMRKKGLKNLLEIHEFRLPVMQRDHVDAENALHRCLLVEVIQHDVGDFAFAQLNDDAHAVLVRFVT